MRSVAGVALAIALLAPAPVGAIVGGAPASPEISARSALIVSTRGASCSSAVLTPDLLLTAAHCVGPKADYAAVVFEAAGPRLVPVARIALHPRYSASAFRKRRPTPDMAVVKLASDLPPSFQPARLAGDVIRAAAGDRFLLAGYGMTVDGDHKSAGKMFSVTLPAIGNTIDATGVIMVRLSADDGTLAGACVGDSGGPVYRGEEVAAVIGWVNSTGERSCGAVTGATLVAPQLDWIAETARRMGSPLEN